ncbi:MAG: carbonate dehydratase [Gemmatimonadaceae bacterium]
MARIEELFRSNKAWAQEQVRKDPSFFRRLIAQQNPSYLWIGCSDSRVPANEIVGLAPGELFVHRNVANLVVHTDLNCLSVLQYAVDVLRVEHVIVTGHYGCGGVRAALSEERSNGLIDNWLRHVQDVAQLYAKELAPLSGEKKCDRLCELNVMEQAVNVSRSTVIRDAWARGQGVNVHGWVYSLEDGIIRDQNVSISSEFEARQLAARLRKVAEKC